MDAVKNLLVGVPLVSFCCLTLFALMGGFGSGVSFVIMVIVLILLILLLGYTVGELIRHGDNSGY